MPLVAQVTQVGPEGAVRSVAEASTAGAFLLRRGDLEPSLSYTLPAGLNLAGSSVRFLVAEQERTPIVDALADITGDRTVRYDWAPADTDEPGRYLAEFEVTFASGTRRTFPEGRYLNIHIKQDLD